MWFYWFLIVIQQRGSKVCKWCSYKDDSCCVFAFFIGSMSMILMAWYWKVMYKVLWIVQYFQFCLVTVTAARRVLCNKFIQFLHISYFGWFLQSVCVLFTGTRKDFGRMVYCLYHKNLHFAFLLGEFLNGIWSSLMMFYDLMNKFFY